MLNPRILVADRSNGLASQLTKVVAGWRPRPDVVRCARVATLDAVLDGEGPFDVVVAGDSLVGEAGMAQLRQVRMAHPRVSLVLAASQRPNATLRDIVRAGAVDFLRLPASDETLAAAVQDALGLAQALNATPVVDQERLVGERASTVLTVLSATGGSGKTFLATNLAYYLHNRHRLRVCVLDLDLQFGELATALRIKPRYTLTDALAHPEGDEDADSWIEEYLSTHDTGVFLLAGPADPVEADGVGAAEVSRLLLALRARFDVVVVDTPASLTEPVLSAVDHSDGILAVATLDLPSVRNMGLLLGTLRQLKIPDDQIQLVLNKVEKDVGIDVGQVTEYFPQGFTVVVPYGREVSRSLNMGMPILAYLPGVDVSRSLAEGLERLAPAGGEPPRATANGAAKGDRNGTRNGRERRSLRLGRKAGTRS